MHNHRHVKEEISCNGWLWGVAQGCQCSHEFFRFCGGNVKILFYFSVTCSTLYNTGLIQYTVQEPVFFLVLQLMLLNYLGIF